MLAGSCQVCRLTRTWVNGLLVRVLITIVGMFSSDDVLHHNMIWRSYCCVYGIPAIAGIGSELIRVKMRHRYNPVVRVMLLPVLGTQKFTTREPTDDLLEVTNPAFNTARQGEEEKAGAAA